MLLCVEGVSSKLVSSGRKKPGGRRFTGNLILTAPRLDGDVALPLREPRRSTRFFSKLVRVAFPCPARACVCHFPGSDDCRVARFVLIGSLILIRGKSSLNDQRNTRNASGTRDPLCLILHLVLIPGLVVCFCLAPSRRRRRRRRKISCHFPLKWPRRSLARSLENLLALFSRETYAGLFESIFCTTAIITVLVTCTMLTDNDAAASLKGGLHLRRRLLVGLLI